MYNASVYDNIQPEELNGDKDENKIKELFKIFP